MKAVTAKYNPEKEYSLEDAAKLVKEITFTKFDASVDVDIRLGVDPKKSDQMVRGVVSLPHGLGKVVRVLVLCTPDKVQEAKDAGKVAVLSSTYPLIAMILGILLLGEKITFSKIIGGILITLGVILLNR